MSLADGGHLTHGHPLNFSGINYEFYSYGVSKETETIDYEEYKKKVEEIKPKLVVAGASAYSRIIDFEFMAKVAHDNGALFMVDMAISLVLLLQVFILHHFHMQTLLLQQHIKH